MTRQCILLDLEYTPDSYAFSEHMYTSFRRLIMLVINMQSGIFTISLFKVQVKLTFSNPFHTQKKKSFLNSNSMSSNPGLRGLIPTDFQGDCSIEKVKQQDQ